MMFTSPDGVWAVTPVALDQPLKPNKMACLPGAPAQHLAVTRHGFVVANVACPFTGETNADGVALLDLSPLADVLPADVFSL